MNSAVNNGPAQRAPSYYTATLNDPTQYPTLTGTEQVDVAIIGGGFTGVATAVELAERGLKVAIVETNRIGWGASGRNGGQVTGSLSGDEAMRTQMRKRLGEDVDDFIWHLRWRGHEIIERRVERYGIDCDLKRGHLHAAMKPSHMDELQASYDEAQRRGMGDLVHLLDRNAVSEHLQSPLYLGALKNRRNLHLHPLNLCLGEARAAHGLGALVFENSEVLEIVHGPRPAVVTARGRIEARQVLLAGDVYHKLEKRQLKGKIFPAMGGIVTTAPLGELADQINPRIWRYTTAASFSTTTVSRPTSACCSAVAPTIRARIRGTSKPSCARASSAPSQRSRVCRSSSNGVVRWVSWSTAFRNWASCRTTSGTARVTLGTVSPPATSWARSWPRR